MSRCFIAERVRKYENIEEQLKEFGPCIYLMHDNEQRPSVYDGVSFSEFIEKTLKSFWFNPRTDYIVLAGSIAKVSYLMGVSCNVFGVTQALLFCDQHQKFVTVDIG